MSYTIHHTGNPGAYRGIIRKDGVEVWRSQETFKNRDESTTYNLAARAVARHICHFLEKPEPQRSLWLEQLQTKNTRGKNDALFYRWCKEQADAIEQRAGATT